MAKRKKSTDNLENSNLHANRASITNRNRKSQTKSKSSKGRKETEEGDEEWVKEKVANIDKPEFTSPMLASIYDGSQDIFNWYMSEKLDGIRCIWNGKTLRSRYGNRFYPPDYFTEKFPEDAVLDGELFLDRKSFSETASIVKRKEPHDGWKKIKYIIFDGPELRGDFKTRLKTLETIIKNCKSPYLELLYQEVCENKEQLDAKMKEILARGGEGVMLKDPSSRYEYKRSKKLLKVKEFQDAEATVIEILKGTGRLSHLMGSLLVRNKDGVEFKIGTGFTDQERAKPPKVGTVVTYRYFELSKDNVPRFPSFLRVYPGL